MGGGSGMQSGSRPLAVAAAAGHGLLYALLIALPLTGWYAASQMGVQVQFLRLHVPALTAPVALLLSVLGGYGLARTALAPVERMARTAAEITAAPT